MYINKIERSWQGTIRIPVGVCQDCGYEWDLRFQMSPNMMMKVIFLLFGFVLCFPIPATDLLWTTNKLAKKVKYILIGLMWGAFFVMFILPQMAFFLF